MDVDTLYKMMKPHLDLLNPSEKTSLSNLIISQKPRKGTSSHRRKFSVSKAKQKLRKFCSREMEKEKMEQAAL